MSDLMHLYKMAAMQDPRNQAPGMGSMQNAMPLQNQLLDRKQALQDEHGEHLGKSVAGYGGTLLGMLGAAALENVLPDPIYSALVGSTIASAGYGMKHNLQQGDPRQFRRLGYQGN
jgi:hypothetical protein